MATTILRTQSTLAGVAALAFSLSATAGIVVPGFDILVDCDSLENTWSAAEAANNGSPPFEWHHTEAGGSVLHSGALEGNGWSISSFNFSYTTNPTQTNSFTFTNTSAVTDTFTITVVTPASFGGSTSTVIGSIDGSLTDNAPHTGATFAAPVGSSVYTAFIDGTAFETLWDEPYSVSNTPPFLTANLGSASFIESGPGVSNSIAITHHFTLSAGDSVTISSALYIIPGPGGLVVFMGGILFGRSRRR